MRLVLCRAKLIKLHLSILISQSLSIHIHLMVHVMVLFPNCCKIVERGTDFITIGIFALSVCDSVTVFMKISFYCFDKVELTA